MRDKLKDHLVMDQPSWVKGTIGTDKRKPECPDRWIDKPENSVVLQVRVDLLPVLETWMLGCFRSTSAAVHVRVRFAASQPLLVSRRCELDASGSCSWSVSRLCV
jgi:hypothetical protein